MKLYKFQKPSQTRKAVRDFTGSRIEFIKVDDYTIFTNEKEEDHESK